MRPWPVHQYNTHCASISSHVPVHLAVHAAGCPCMIDRLTAYVTANTPDCLTLDDHRPLKTELGTGLLEMNPQTV